ncbi:MAG: glutathione S-transferase family protein [Myxococcota bacterium]
MKFYYNPLSPNSRRAWATINHLELTNKVEAIVVEMSKGEHMKPEFLAMNPNHKVPVLVDGDFKLWESAAIMTYLCEMTPNQKLWGSTPRLRADTMRWMSWHLAHFGQAVGTYNWEYAFKPMQKQTPDMALIEKAAVDFHKFAPVLNAHLENKKWLVNEELSLADFYIGAGFQFEPMSKLPLENYPHIRAWHTRLMAIPSWAKTAPKLG